jgi:hypothetical protein
MPSVSDITSIDFFEAGKAIFTVSNPIGDHYTYKITKKEKGPFFVALLTGPDNTSDYTYLGIYHPGKRSITLTAKSKFTETSTPVRVIRWAIIMIKDGKGLPRGYTIRHEGRCCRCGRMLTTPESIERGIGPECMKKSGW